MSQKIQIGVKYVLIGAFVLGLSTGFLGGVFTAAGLSEASAPSQVGDAPSPSPTRGESQGGDFGVSVSFDTKGEPVLGQKDAPVTIAYWGDYQCPFCKRFEQNTFPKLKENYISTGKVRLVFKDYQFLGPDSKTAGVASECVWKQVKNSNPKAFWNWHAEMYDKQDGENSGWGDKQDIIEMTKSIKGVDAQKLSTCMKNNRQKFLKEISQDQQEGSSAGITGTPGFVIYKTGAERGTKLVGAQPYSRFKSVIRQVQSSDSGTQETAGEKKVDKTIQVSGTEYSFSKTIIQVEKGQTVRIEFTNTGSIPHNLRIPGLGVGSETLRPDQTDSFTFTAPESGSYPIRFECSLPGHASNGMKGNLRI
ncbi:MAG: thioredoxin domain-containing protein [Candidatus Nanosalina sp.]